MNVKSRLHEVPNDFIYFEVEKGFHIYQLFEELSSFLFTLNYPCIIIHAFYSSATGPWDNIYFHLGIVRYET